ncbi:hypothetical protein FBU30_000669 [Linnemannia zychae]|nr:hypothetical protein FBU30_000669 [Linnemannia zychae]
MVKESTYSKLIKTDRSRKIQNVDTDKTYKDDSLLNNTLGNHDNESDNDNNDNNDNDIDEGELEEEEAEFEVERVVGHRRGRGSSTSSLFYLLKWKDYDWSDNTWEKESNVHCADLVAEYWERYEQAGGKKADSKGLESMPQLNKRKLTKDKSFSRHAQEDIREQAVTAKKRRIRSYSSDVDNIEVEYIDDSDDDEDGLYEKKQKNRTISKEKRSIINVDKEDRDDRDEKHSKSQDSELDEIEEDDKWNPPKSWSSWETHIDFIRTIVQGDNNKLTIFLRWKNGYETSHPIEVAHEKFPLVLIRYYESHLRFLKIVGDDARASAELLRH